MLSQPGGLISGLDVGTASYAAGSRGARLRRLPTSSECKEGVMNIGEERRTIVIEPIEEPVQVPSPAPAEEPVPEPVGPAPAP